MYGVPSPMDNKAFLLKTPSARTCQNRMSWPSTTSWVWHLCKAFLNISLCLSTTQALECFAREMSWNFHREAHCKASEDTIALSPSQIIMLGVPWSCSQCVVTASMIDSGVLSMIATATDHLVHSSTMCIIMWSVGCLRSPQTGVAAHS